MRETKQSVRSTKISKCTSKCSCCKCLKVSQQTSTNNNEKELIEQTIWKEHNRLYSMPNLVKNLPIDELQRVKSQIYKLLLQLEDVTSK